jgi:hypothetical protein
MENEPYGYASEFFDEELILGEDEQEDEQEHRHVATWLVGSYGHSLYFCFECSKPLTIEEAKLALAGCEDCGKAFEQSDPKCYFEIGEYSYCGECCNR